MNDSDIYTRFWDLSTGGYDKTAYEVIYVKGREREAAEIFRNRFSIDPYDVSCECCGEDFGIDEISQDKLPVEEWTEASDWVILDQQETDE